MNIYVQTFLFAYTSICMKLYIAIFMCVCVCARAVCVCVYCIEETEDTVKKKDSHFGREKRIVRKQKYISACFTVYMLKHADVC
jgi:hypothetical protein